MANPVIAVRAAELPLVAGGEVAVGETVVLAQIGGMLGLAAPRQIGRRRADHALGGRDLAGDQTRRRQVGDAQGDVEAFLHRIDLLIAQHQLDLQLRVPLHEVRDRAAEVERAERHRRIDAQEPARLRLQPRHREVGLLEIGQYGDAALVIGLAVLGRAGAARGADEKLDAEFLLELDHVFAHRRAGQPQFPGGGRKAAVLHHPGEGPDAGQLVHVSPRSPPRGEIRPQRSHRHWPAICRILATICSLYDSAPSGSSPAYRRIAVAPEAMGDQP